MSRIGKKPIEIPKDVTVDLRGSVFSVKGPKGTLKRELPPHVKVKVEGSTVVVDRVSKERRFGAFQGLARALLAPCGSVPTTRHLTISGIFTKAG